MTYCIFLGIIFNVLLRIMVVLLRYNQMNAVQFCENAA